MRLRARIRAAIAALRSHATYAVIYDSPETGAEEFYEMFGSPEQAHEFFRSAFPHGTDNPRLVLILGPIDDYDPHL